MSKDSIKTIWHWIKQYPIIGIPYQKLFGKKKTEKLFKEKSEHVKKYGVSAVKYIEEALINLGVPFYIDFGSLLGVIRDRKFIEWDPDIDYAIVVDKQFEWNKLQGELGKYGFRKIKEWKQEGIITEQTFQIEKLTVDFFAHYIEGSSMEAFVYSRVKGHIYKNNEFGVYSVITPRVFDTTQVSIGEVSVSVPTNAEEYLASLYNTDWKIPNPNWVAFSGPAYHLLPGCVGIPTEYE